MDEDDHRHFLEVVEQCREISLFRLYAYCLMGKHIHILLQTVDEPLEPVMKRIRTRFVVWYNQKYYRTGNLFLDWYRSELVQDQAYFLTVLRYIMNNSVKAGIRENTKDYPWSIHMKCPSYGGELSTKGKREGC